MNKPVERYGVKVYIEGDEIKSEPVYNHQVYKNDLEELLKSAIRERKRGLYSLHSFKDFYEFDSATTGYYRCFEDIKLEQLEYLLSLLTQRTE